MTIYRGVGGVNRQIKSQHRCLSGVNRTIKEQYRGLGGVNRKAFSSTLVLYDNGNEYAEITGGWAYGYSNGNTKRTKQATYLELWASGTSSNRAQTAYVTNNLINLAGHTTLNFQISQSVASTQGYGEYGAKTSKTSQTAYAAVLYVKSGAVDVMRTVSLDISTLNGSYYVSVFATNGGGINTTCKVAKVWVE